MRAFKHPPTSDFNLERVLYALSDPVRLDVVRRLADVEQASCGDLDGGRPKSSMSHHFRVLRDAGLVCTQAVGTTHMNTLRRAELDERFPGLLAAILAQYSPCITPTHQSDSGLQHGRVEATHLGSG